MPGRHVWQVNDNLVQPQLRGQLMHAIQSVQKFISAETSDPEERQAKQREYVSYLAPVLPNTVRGQ